MAYTEHLKALLERAQISDKKRNTIVTSLQVRDAGTRKTAIEALQATLPGIAERLDEIWIDNRARAVHFFRVPILDGASHASMKRVVNERFGDEAGDGRWYQLPRRRGHTPHPRLIRLGKRALDMRVRLYLDHHAQLDDEITEYKTHQDVDAQIQFAREGGAIAEVFATTVHARSGLRLALGTLLATEIPKKRCAAQEKFMLPLRFNEAHVKGVANELALEVTELDGIDPEDSLGGFSVYGKEDGEVRKALPADDPRVKIRERAGNVVRQYRYGFDHRDGYTERAEVRFALAAQHPHVTFTRVSSRPAKRWILDALLAKITV